MDADSYMSDYQAKRGYSRSFPAKMASLDLSFQELIGAVADKAYGEQRSLSRRERELVLIGILVACGATAEHLASHVSKAMDMGIGPREVLETLELAALPCGVVVFEKAIGALDDAIGFVNVVREASA